MSDNPKQYKLDSAVLSMIWVALHESGQEDLAQVVADTMIAQGCEELEGDVGPLQILTFWKNHLEESNLVSFEQDKGKLN